RSGSRALYSAAVEALGLVLGGCDDATAILADLFATAPADARAWLVHFLPWPGSIKREEKVKFLRAALHDRSPVVRLNAASAAASARLAELAAVIDELIAREADVSTRDFLV